MKRRITRIAPLQAGKITGVLYACMGLIFIPFFAFAALAGAFAQQAQQTQGVSTAPMALLTGVMIGFGIFMPIIYGVMGFLMGIIGAALYNLTARWIGGFEVEVEPLEASIS
jgi:hypothetical protein